MRSNNSFAYDDVQARATETNRDEISLMEQQQ